MYFIFQHILKKVYLAEEIIKKPKLVEKAKHVSDFDA